jgi:hypothetical protein
VLKSCEFGIATGAAKCANIRHAQSEDLPDFLPTEMIACRVPAGLSQIRKISRFCHSMSTSC